MNALKLYYQTNKHPKYEDIGELSIKIGTNKVKTNLWFEKCRSKDHNYYGSKPGKHKLKQRRMKFNPE